MPSFYSEGNTPRLRDTQLRVQQKTLGALRDVLTTLGGGAGGSGGANFRFTSDSPSKLQIKNVDDGLWHTIEAAQPTPNQTVQLQDGQA